MAAMREVLVWLASVAGISLAIALFEISIERNQGWCANFNPRGWGRKLFENSWLAGMAEKHYFTAYHFFMFLLVLPLMLVLEYFILRRAGAIHPVGPHSWVGSFGGSPVALPLFFLAVWTSILTVEDFLWFALNWYYPGSLRQLLAGKIWWHTRWLKIGAIQIPRFYVPTQIAAVAILAASFRLGLHY